MRLSINLEYFGDCKDVLNFYRSVFHNASVIVKPFKEMDMAEALGITDGGLDMVWQSELCIPYGDGVLCVEMADSLMVAMGRELGFSRLYFNPVIHVSCDDENYARCLFQKLYGDMEKLESLQDGNFADLHGIRWQYRKSSGRGIAHCLTFDGFCSDVIAFYEKVFRIKAAEVVKYGDSLCGDKIPAEGADKIYSATLPFVQGDQIYALRLRDSYESAVEGINTYDPKALLFYQGQYNPVFTLRDADTSFLSEAFTRLTDGAKLNRPLASGDDGALFGSLIDKYGICWNFRSAMGRMETAIS